MHVCTHADSISRDNNVAAVPVWLGKKAASSPEKSTVTIRVGELGQRPGQVLKLELAKTTTIAGVKQAACLQRYVEHGSTVLHNHMSVECSHGPRLHRHCDVLVQFRDWTVQPLCMHCTGTVRMHCARAVHGMCRHSTGTAQTWFRSFAGIVQAL